LTRAAFRHTVAPLATEEIGGSVCDLVAAARWAAKRAEERLQPSLPF
jgi:hypothetical protein